MIEKNKDFPRKRTKDKPEVVGWVWQSLEYATLSIQISGRWPRLQICVFVGWDKLQVGWDKLHYARNEKDHRLIFWKKCHTMNIQRPIVELSIRGKLKIQLCHIDEVTFASRMETKENCVGRWCSRMQVAMVTKSQKVGTNKGQPTNYILTWVCTICYNQHPQWAEAYISLIPLS